MSQFKVEFTLKQHTPIIHFQSEQHGATLRATELKPKFDRFLLENVDAIVYKKNTNGFKSLDYKVKIISGTTDIESIERIIGNGRAIPDPLFFGNMGGGEKKKFVSSKLVKIEFFSFNTDVIDAIKNNFEAFISQTNFGTRQSKGFGSFFLENKKFNPAILPFKVYSFSSSNWKNDIKLFYSFLRAGINTSNFGGIYAKAMIFSYAKSKGISWDKKAIKAKYISEENIDTTQYNLVRDLFGLSSEQSWMSYRATVSKENEDIDRFKSPITFKIIDNKVYFWADTSVESILNKRFKIKYNNRGNLELNTPGQFSFDDFFNYAFNTNLAQYIDAQYHNDRNGEFNNLNRIFKEIKASL